MLRPPGVTDAPPARRVRGRRSSLVLGVLILTAVVSTRWVRLNLSASLPYGLYRMKAVPAEPHRGDPRGAPGARECAARLVVLDTAAETRGRRPRGCRVCAGGQVAVNGSDYGPVSLESHDAPCRTWRPDAIRCQRAWYFSPVRHRKVSMVATLG